MVCGHDPNFSRAALNFSANQSKESQDSASDSTRLPGTKSARIVSNLKKQLRPAAGGSNGYDDRPRHLSPV
jgi:hypothetical protein